MPGAFLRCKRTQHQHRVVCDGNKLLSRRFSAAQWTSEELPPWRFSGVQARQNAGKFCLARLLVHNARCTTLGAAVIPVSKQDRVLLDFGLGLACVQSSCIEHAHFKANAAGAAQCAHEQTCCYHNQRDLLRKQTTLCWISFGLACRMIATSKRCAHVDRMLLDFVCPEVHFHFHRSEVPRESW